MSKHENFAAVEFTVDLFKIIQKHIRNKKAVPICPSAELIAQFVMRVEEEIDNQIRGTDESNKVD